MKGIKIVNLYYADRQNCYDNRQNKKPIQNLSGFHFLFRLIHISP